jgi:hypothetical protein
LILTQRREGLGPDRPGSLDKLPGNADDGGIRGDILENHRVCAYYRMWPDCYPAKKLRTRSDDDVVAHPWIFVCFSGISFP